jgi:hypothetical protein
VADLDTAETLLVLASAAVGKAADQIVEAGATTPNWVVAVPDSQADRTVGPDFDFDFGFDHQNLASDQTAVSRTSYYH